MASLSTSFYPIISVIIPCYNHGGYLGKAIDSVLGQSYPNVEVIVVDDGSSDDTREVAAAYGEKVRYIYKENGGLSAARNTGLEHAKGAYIVFLDADDWLYPKALQTNLHYLNLHPTAAFVSGSHIRIFIEKNIIKPEKQDLKHDHYTSLLLYNYIGVPASVLYHRWVFDQFQFDVNLKSCEDYDLYLKVARRYPVYHHNEMVAAYRMHSSSMSTNTARMISTAMIVLNRQKKETRNQQERMALEEGKTFMKSYYCWLLYENIKLKNLQVAAKFLPIFIKYRPRYIFRLLHYKLLTNLKLHQASNS